MWAGPITSHYGVLQMVWWLSHDTDDLLAKVAPSKKIVKIIAIDVGVILLIYRKLGDGLFLKCCKEVAADYPDIIYESMIVDNTTMQVKNP